MEQQEIGLTYPSRDQKNPLRKELIAEKPCPGQQASFLCFSTQSCRHEPWRQQE